MQHSLPVAVIEKDVMAGGSHDDIREEAVERGHLVDVALHALFVAAVPAGVHQGQAHAYVEAHHPNKLEGQQQSFSWAVKNRSTMNEGRKEDKSFATKTDDR